MPPPRENPRAAGTGRLQDLFGGIGWPFVYRFHSPKMVAHDGEQRLTVLGHLSGADQIGLVGDDDDRRLVGGTAHVAQLVDDELERLLRRDGVDQNDRCDRSALAEVVVLPVSNTRAT